MGAIVDWALTKLVEPKWVDSSEERFKWFSAHQKKPGAVGDKNKDYYLAPNGNLKAVYTYIYDTATEDLRRGTEPHHMKTILAPMALLTPVLLIATLVVRIMQAVFYLSMVVFEAFDRAHPMRNETDFALQFGAQLVESKEANKKQLKRVWKRYKRDLRCSAAMEIAALRGMVSQDPQVITRMVAIFTKTEQEWNDGIDFRKTPFSLFLKSVKEWAFLSEPQAAQYLIKASRDVIDNGNFGPQKDVMREVLKELQFPLEYTEETIQQQMMAIKISYFKKRMAQFADECVPGLILYQCAQPLPKGMKERVIPVSQAQTFGSYKELTEYYEMRSEETKKSFEQDL